MLRAWWWWAALWHTARAPLETPPHPNSLCWASTWHAVGGPQMEQHHTNTAPLPTQFSLTCVRVLSGEAFFTLSHSSPNLDVDTLNDKMRATGAARLRNVQVRACYCIWGNGGPRPWR